MYQRLSQFAATIKDELTVYQLVMAHPSVPNAAKFLIGCAIAYLLSPIDLIPDFIPGLGQLDDLIIVPTLIFIALAIIPREIVEECRHAVKFADF
jgi:uncharacterized membrane protein YkvA (DUF1232 family)